MPRQQWSRVGHLVDSPLAYPELTARQNLRIAALLHRADPDRCVDSALERWELQALSSRRLRHLSLGNRQRVGLAAALQHAPDLGRVSKVVRGVGVILDGWFVSSCSPMS